MYMTTAPQNVYHSPAYAVGFHASPLECRGAESHGCFSTHPCDFHGVRNMFCFYAPVRRGCDGLKLRITRVGVATATAIYSRCFLLGSESDVPRGRLEVGSVYAADPAQASSLTRSSQSKDIAKLSTAMSTPYVNATRRS
jgi:hypothetical protein